MEKIKEDFGLNRASWKLEYFSEYLKDVEELIDSKAEELDNRAKMMSQELKQDEDLPWEHINPDRLAYFLLKEDYEKIGDVFPNLLRRSFFMYVYSVLEDALNNCCRLLNYQGMSLGDIKDKGRGIKRAKQYLEEANVNFPDNREWHKILLYQRLRNCITHNQGRLNGCNKKDKNVIRNFALRSNSHLSLTYTDKKGKEAVGMSDFVEIVVHKGFCEEVIRIIISFLKQLRINMEGRSRNEAF